MLANFNSAATVKMIPIINLLVICLACFDDSKLSVVPIVVSGRMELGVCDRKLFNCKNRVVKIVLQINGIFCRFI